MLSAGALLILAAVAAVFTGHGVVAGGLALTGLVALVTGAVLSRMEGPFRLFGFSGNLRAVDPPTGEIEPASLQQLPPGEERIELPAPPEEAHILPAQATSGE